MNHLPVMHRTGTGLRSALVAVALISSALVLSACRPAASSTNVSSSSAHGGGGGSDDRDGMGHSSASSTVRNYTRDDETVVVQEKISRTVPAVGAFVPKQSTMLGTQVGGRVDKVLADVGDVVDAKKPLVILDMTFLDLEIAQRTADLNSAKAAEKDAQLNFNRMKALFEKPEGVDPSVPRKLFDDATSRLDQAKAVVAVAQAGVSYATQRKAEATIRAPFRGVITERKVDPGASVTSTPMTEIMEIQEIHTLYLEFSLPQDQLGDVRETVGDTPGTPVSFLVDGLDREGSGNIARIFPAINASTRSFRCRREIANPDLKFRPGMLVTVRVTMEEVPDALVVPRSSLARD
ncbi:MAG: efflux RND transporter periplasmic adaptor subunit, partial [Planctomycetota bacterium]